MLRRRSDRQAVDGVRKDDGAAEADARDMITFVLDGYRGYAMEAHVYQGDALIHTEKYDSNEGSHYEILPQLIQAIGKGDARIELHLETGHISSGLRKGAFLTIQKSNIDGAGAGLFAGRDLPKATILATYTGKRYTVDVNGQSPHNPLYVYAHPSNSKVRIDPTEGRQPRDNGMKLYSGIQTVNAVDGAFEVRFSDTEHANVKATAAKRISGRPACVVMYTDRDVSIGEELLTTYHWAMNPDDTPGDESNYIAEAYWEPGWYDKSPLLDQRLSLQSDLHISTELEREIRDAKLTTATDIYEYMRNRVRERPHHAVLWWLATYWAIQRLAYTHWRANNPVGESRDHWKEIWGDRWPKRDSQDMFIEYPFMFFHDSIHAHLRRLRKDYLQTTADSVRHTVADHDSLEIRAIHDMLAVDLVDTLFKILTRQMVAAGRKPSASAHDRQTAHAIALAPDRQALFAQLREFVTATQAYLLDTDLAVRLWKTVKPLYDDTPTKDQAASTWTDLKEFALATEAHRYEPHEAAELWKIWKSNPARASKIAERVNYLYKGKHPDAALFAVIWKLVQESMETDTVIEMPVLKRLLEVRQQSSQKAHLMATGRGSMKARFVQTRTKQAQQQATGSSDEDDHEAAGYVVYTGGKGGWLHAAFQKLKF